MTFRALVFVSTLFKFYEFKKNKKSFKKVVIRLNEFTIFPLT